MRIIRSKHHCSFITLLTHDRASGQSVNGVAMAECLDTARVKPNFGGPGFVAKVVLSIAEPTGLCRNLKM